MKKIRILSTIVAICYTTSLFAQNKNETVRINQLFNFGWKFKAGEIPTAQNSTFDVVTGASWICHMIFSLSSPGIKPLIKAVDLKRWV